MSTPSVTVGQWNMLASSLSLGEFLSASKEPAFMPWEKRTKKIVAVLGEMMRICDFVVVVENDRPWEILELLQELKKSYSGVAVVDRSEPGKASVGVQQDGGKDRANNINETWKLQGFDETYEGLEQSIRNTVKSRRLYDQAIAHMKLERELAGGDKKLGKNRLVAADHIVIYYDSALYDVVEHNTEDKSISTKLRIDKCQSETNGCSRLPECTEGFRHHLWTFKRKKTTRGYDRNINIIGGHLAGGTAQKDVATRTTDMEKLAITVRGVSDDEPLFVAVDSNYDGMTTEGTKRMHEFESMGLSDGLDNRSLLLDPDKENLQPADMDGCFKMRHTGGNQPTKFCALIFARIDRILGRTLANAEWSSHNLSHFISSDLFDRHGLLSKSEVEEKTASGSATHGSVPVGDQQNTLDGLAHIKTLLDMLVVDLTNLARVTGSKITQEKIEQFVVDVQQNDRLIAKDTIKSMSTEIQKYRMLFLADQAPKQKEVDKALGNIEFFLTKLSKLHTRPNIEQMCEKNFWKTLAADGVGDKMKRMYPNERAVSDHPPYIVLFVPTATSDCTETSCPTSNNGKTQAELKRQIINEKKTLDFPKRLSGLPNKLSNRLRRFIANDK